MMLPVCLCVDQRMLGGLHVAAWSLLRNLSTEYNAHFHVFSDELTNDDVDLLKNTLEATERDFELTHHRVDLAVFADFPQLNGSFATYFRLVLPDILMSGRVLYIDADTMTRLDVSRLFEIDLAGCPIALAPEALIHECPDPTVSNWLGSSATGNYYNAGVMVLDIDAWRSENLTHKCLSFVAEKNPVFHDQSALNFVLHGRIHPLDDKYNCRTNVRRFWPMLRSPGFGDGTILHFVDFPKPWSSYGRLFHPFGKLWWNELSKTAFTESSMRFTEQSIPLIDRLILYKMAVKDKLLFRLYNSRLKLGVRGVPQ